MREKIEARFPWYVAAADKMAMAMSCAAELAAWRETVAHHKSLLTVNMKLNHRKTLEKSFETLKAAWVMASAPVELVAAA